MSAQQTHNPVRVWLNSSDFSGCSDFSDPSESSDPSDFTDFNPVIPIQSSDLSDLCESSDPSDPSDPSESSDPSERGWSGTLQWCSSAAVFPSFPATWILAAQLLRSFQPWSSGEEGGMFVETAAGGIAGKNPCVPGRQHFPGRHRCRVQPSGDKSLILAFGGFPTECCGGGEWVAVSDLEQKHHVAPDVSHNSQQQLRDSGRLSAKIN